MPLPTSVDSSPHQSDYEEVGMPSCSDLHSEIGCHFENPLYTDVTYVHVGDTNIDSRITENDLCPRAIYAQAMSLGCINRENHTHADSAKLEESSSVESGHGSQVEQCSGQEPTHSYEMCDIRDPEDYSNLDPTTQYSTLVPFIGPSLPNSTVLSDTILGHEDVIADDYCHLNH